MKNAFKISILALAVSFSVAACHGSGSSNGGDSTSKDSSASKSVDTTSKTDSSKKDTTVIKADTTKPAAGGDTVKSVVKQTEVKKVTTKKQ